MKRLRSVLVESKWGNIPAQSIESALVECWTELRGHDSAGMKPEKLINRMEDVNWHPPELTFKIERHGGTACGSSRAEIQTWVVNIDEQRAFVSTGGYRQLKPPALMLDVRPIAAEIAALIRERKESPLLKWLTLAKVKLNMERIIPSGGVPKQTLSGRRKRFRKALDEALSDCTVEVR